MAEQAFSPEEVEDGKVLAAIGYLSFLFFLPLVVKPNNRFCRAHAKQALVLFVAGTVVGLLSCFLSQFGGGMLGLLILVLQIIALVKTLQGEYWRIPGVAELADRITL